LSRSQPLIYIVIVLSLLTALSTLRVIPLGLTTGFVDMLPHIDIRPIAFIAHISAASVALVTGGFQLLPWLRKNHINWHRWNGRVYVLAVICGGVSGFWLGLSALGGPIALLGFVVLAVLWCITTVVAVVRVRAGNIKAHRAWMYRSFALTFGAVTLRLQLAVFLFFGVDYVTASVWLAWSAWVPNILLVEYMLRRESAKS